MTTEGLHRLVERQGRSWEAAQRAHDDEGTPGLHAPSGPWISISRQLGAHGDELATLLAARLGWQVFDREILARVAAETHASEPVLAHHDERAGGVLDDMLAQLVVPDDPGRAAYVQEMMRVARDIARHGAAIILGRGVNWFLDPAYGVRVRVVAPEAQRVAALLHDRPAAAAVVRQELAAHDAAQRAFVRQTFGRDIDDPLGYDAVLNLGSLDVERAADLVEAALVRRLTPAR